MTAANTITEADGRVRRCLMCRGVSLHERLRQHHQPHPSTTGVCRRGLHVWSEDNWIIDARSDAVRCRPCREQAHRLIYARTRVIHCVVKGCPRATYRADGTYLCRLHRRNPPAWLARLGLQIVGTQVIAGDVTVSIGGD